MQKTYALHNLDCANCAAKIEDKFNKLPEVEKATIVFPSRKLILIAEDPDALLEQLDPRKVFFVVGHKLQEHEKYLVEHNRNFDIYSIIPSLMDPKQIRRLSQADIKGIRISTESQEMGIYKSFNYEIFERRNCTLQSIRDC